MFECRSRSYSYLNNVISGQRYSGQVGKFCSKRHTIHRTELRKIALDNYDDKILIHTCGIHNSLYGSDENTVCNICK